LPQNVLRIHDDISSPLVTTPQKYGRTSPRRDGGVVPVGRGDACHAHSCTPFYLPHLLHSRLRALARHLRASALPSAPRAFQPHGRGPASSSALHAGRSTTLGIFYLILSYACWPFRRTITNFGRNSSAGRWRVNLSFPVPALPRSNHGHLLPPPPGPFMAFACLARTLRRLSGRHVNLAFLRLAGSTTAHHSNAHALHLGCHIL